MNESYREHPSEEALERFLLNMSPEEEIEELETHVLACGQCVDKLEMLETQIAATRMALQSLEDQQTSPRSVEKKTPWQSWFTFQRLSFAVTGTLAAAGMLFFTIPRDVSVTAYRGTETAIVAEGRPLHMHLNAAGLDAGPIEIELADSKGSIDWRGTSVVRLDTIDVTTPRILQSGPHYVRIYSAPQIGTESTLLREFALDARWTF